jgi:phosphatidylglycerol:prolipoprotein diacylglycerol transferase
MSSSGYRTFDTAVDLRAKERHPSPPVRPELIDLGIFSIKGYGLMIGLSIPICFWLLSIESRRSGLPALETHLGSIFLWVIAAVYLGGKLVYALGYPEGFADLKRTRGLMGVLSEGFVFYGSILTAIPVTLYALRRYGIPMVRGLDVLIYGLPIAHGFGRLGCFLAGCCYGSHSTGPLAVTFTEGQGLNGTPLHPVQLYEAGGSLIIFIVLWFWVRRREPFPGQVLLSYLVLYAILRLITEQFRGDGNPVYVGGDEPRRAGDPPVGLTQAQVISIVLLAISVPLLWWKRRRQREV